MIVWYFPEEVKRSKNMLSYWWPIALIVFSNVVYNVCAKASPEGIDPLASLTVTYAVSAVFSGILYILLSGGGSLLHEYHHLNWTVFAFGFALVGLEAGSLYMYKAGWDISAGQIVHSALLAVCLVAVGAIVYHEQISVSKIAGILLIFSGLVIMNR